MPLAYLLVSSFANFGGNILTISFSGNMLIITGFTASMAVNTLVTGMIVFRILKVTRAMPSTSVERILGSTGGNKYRHIMFIIIESGMALFAIQLVRIVLAFRIMSMFQEPLVLAANEIVIVINQMLNVIIMRSVHSYLFFLLITFA